MLNTKLDKLLKTFSVYELNRFGKFLASPYFNENRKMILCFELVAPLFKKKLPPCSKKEIWKHVFSSARFSNLKFARLCSDLAKKADEFMLHDQLHHSEIQKLLGTLHLYNNRKLDKYFGQTWKYSRDKHLKQPLRDAEFYLHQFQLEAAHNTYLELQNRRTTEKNILETIETLDRFYFIHKLNYLSALLHYKKFLSATGEVVLSEEILRHLKANPPADIPAIAINYRIVLSLIEPDNEAHFFELRKLLMAHASLFPKDAARNFYAFVINFCIRSINFGKRNYEHELFALYKEMLHRNLMWDEAGSILQFDFKNIVTVALRAGDARWAEKFIRDYKKHIPKDDRQNAFTFNLARLYFYQKKYDRVLPLLQDVKYSDIFYQLDSKTTLMKTYYELGEYLPLMALKESFRILLRRKKLISEQNRINYMNFIRFTMKLYRADVKNQKKMISLNKQIAESTNVADKSWLMEKLGEMLA